MSDIFSLSENRCYNLRSGNIENRQNIRTSKLSFVPVSTIGAILWSKLPAELKNSEILNIFKKLNIFKYGLGVQMIVTVKYVENLENL